MVAGDHGYLRKKAKPVPMLAGRDGQDHFFHVGTGPTILISSRAKLSKKQIL